MSFHAGAPEKDYTKIYAEYQAPTVDSLLGSVHRPQYVEQTDAAASSHGAHVANGAPPSVGRISKVMLEWSMIRRSFVI
jgi:hypothetical protein